MVSTSAKKHQMQLLETELSEIGASLQRVMEETMRILSRQQREMDRWKKLAKWKWDDCGSGSNGMPAAMPNDSPRAATAHSIGGCEDNSNSFHRAPAFDNQGDLPVSCSVDASMVSENTAARLEAMRQKETKIRDLLCGLKETSGNYNQIE